MHLLALKLIWTSWKRSALNQILGCFTFGTLLAIGACLLFFSKSLAPVLKDVETRSQVMLFVKADLPEAKESAMVDQIRETLGSSVKVNWIGRKDFVQTLSRESPKLAEQVYSLGKEFDAVVPRMVSIEGLTDAEKILGLQEMEAVESVEQSNHKWKPVLSAMRGFQWGAAFLGVALWVAGVFGVFQWVRTQRGQLDQALASIDLMGGQWTDRWMPVVFTGVLFGVLSAIVSAVLWLAYSVSFSSGVKALSPFFAQLSQPQWTGSLSLGMVSIVLSTVMTTVGFIRLRARG